VEIFRTLQSGKELAIAKALGLGWASVYNFDVQ